jgi:hypothetical protein
MRTWGSLGAFLEFAFPTVIWDQKKFKDKGKKSSQRYEIITTSIYSRMLFLKLGNILPEKTEIVL